MSEAAVPLSSADGELRPGARAMFLRVAWRNLGRRRLRTWLSVAGIAFAIYLVSVLTALQAGVYGPWVETATGLSTGHLQVQHPAFFDDPKVDHTLPNGTALVRTLANVPNIVDATARADTFVLVSAGERSFGALVMGVDADREARMFTLPKHIREGEYLPRADSAFIGSALASNLGAKLGDEVVALGSAKEGGVAALVLTVDGIFDTGRADLDRSVMQAPLAAMQDAFELGDAVHRVVLLTEDPNRMGGLKSEIEALAPADARTLDWSELLPEVAQGIEIDAMIGEMMYWLLMIVVAMSVVNSFIMTVFERTREFGMLLAIGMRPNAIMGMLTVEAICLWTLGALAGLAATVATVLPVNAVGIQTADFIEGMAAQIGLPDALRPVLDARALTLAPLVMLAGTLLAAVVPALRVRKMRPVEALREEE